MRNTARIQASVLFAAIIASLVPTKAPCVVNIREEAWNLPSSIRRDVVMPPDSSSALDLEFEADVTVLDRDPAGGVTFYITERDAGVGDGDQLFKVVLPCAALPPVGYPIHVFAIVSIACDADGRLNPGRVIQWALSSCGPTGTLNCFAYGGGLSTLPETSDAESFEFALQDENLVEGPNPTTEDAVGCRPHGFGGLDPLAPLARIGSAEREISGQLTESIGIYFDSGGTVCSRSVTAFEQFDLYILAKTSGFSTCGITGAEFRVLGLPDGWFVSQVTPPGAIVFGSPFADGVNIAWGSCQQGDAIQLFRYIVLPTTSVTDQVLSVARRNPPSNPMHPWPLFVLCDAPIYTTTRADAVNAILNPTMPAQCDVLVGVRPATWTVVKDLFR